MSQIGEEQREIIVEPMVIPVPVRETPARPPVEVQPVAEPAIVRRETREIEQPV